MSRDSPPEMSRDSFPEREREEILQLPHEIQHAWNLGFQINHIKKQLLKVEAVQGVRKPWKQVDWPFGLCQLHLVVANLLERCFWMRGEGRPLHSHQGGSWTISSALSRLLLLLLQLHLALPVTTSPWPTEPETEEPGVLAPAAKCQVHFLFYLVSTVRIYEANGTGQPSLWTPSPSLSLPINAYCAVTRCLLYPDPRCFQSRSRD